MFPLHSNLVQRINGECRLENNKQIELDHFCFCGALQK